MPFSFPVISRHVDKKRKEKKQRSPQSAACVSVGSPQGGPFKAAPRQMFRLKTTAATREMRKMFSPQSFLQKHSSINCDAAQLFVKKKEKSFRGEEVVKLHQAGAVTALKHHLGRVTAKHIKTSLKFLQ